MTLGRPGRDPRVSRGASRALAVALLILALVLLGVTGVARVGTSSEPPMSSIPVSR
jgi:hypothetical protein